MYYEITVTKGVNKSLIFSTCDKSILNEDELKEVYGQIAERFTEDQGYEVSVMLRYTKGNQITMFQHGNGSYEVKQ